MSVNRTYPKKILNMIFRQYEKGRSAHEIAKHVNSSATASNLDITVSVRSIAAVMANLTRGNYSEFPS